MATFDIGQVDRNMVAETVNEPNLELYDVREAPFQIYGLYKPQTEPVFKRIPTNVAEKTSKGVLNLHTNTAGGRVRFSTDSPYVVIKAVMPQVGISIKMPRTGSSGFDLYTDSADGSDSFYVGTFLPPSVINDGYTAKLALDGIPGMRALTINFPLYNDVTALYVGIAKGSRLEAGVPYRGTAPIVFYGSSITQGACASRPGNAYTAQVARRFGMDHINLGFSGNGKAEDAILDYMAGLDMSVFVSDYDHNAPDPTYLEKTHCKLYKAIRATHPDIPYIMLSRPDFYAYQKPLAGTMHSRERRAVVMNTYQYAMAQGDQNVYYIDGEQLLPNDSCTVDALHPSDLGFYFMAERVSATLQQIKRLGKLS
ncbi:MAG: hypothetical protein E7585_02845 [Ruminococcaceae bacterium]|nr:hypothetical protein [Oscillospiraceae bacterium]